MLLLPEHRTELINGSGLTDGILAARGYYSATSQVELAALGFSSDQQRVPALVLPVLGVDGDIVGFQAKPVNPRVKDGKAIKYETLPRWKMRLDVPPPSLAKLGDPQTPLYITEGIKKADAAAARGLCCVALLGVWNWRGANAWGGVVELAEWDRIALKGRRCFIVFDSDIIRKKQVKTAMARLARALKRRGAREVVPVVLPEPNGAKVGLDDWFVQGGDPRQLPDLADYEILSGRRIVVNGRPLGQISDDAMEALIETNDPPRIFVRGGTLVNLTQDEHGVARIRDLGVSSLRGILARSAAWIKSGEKADVDVSPPKDVVEDILGLNEWPDVPALEAVCFAPILTKEGLVTAQGYDPTSRFYIASDEPWTEWEGDYQTAREYLYDLLSDFPFATASDRAHAIAAMLLGIVRPSIKGATPLHLIDAPTRSTGKSLLARVLMMPAAGDKIASVSGTRDEEEWRKKISANLREGAPFVFLDNLSKKIDSESLTKALTDTYFKDRLLSTMETFSVPVRCTWMATTNNAELSTDVMTRSVWIRLDAKLEHPEERKGFRRPDIEAHVLANRQTIVAALLCLVRHWVQAGRPPYSGKHVNRYPEWRNTIGGILECAEVDGFLDNIAALRIAASADDDGWPDFYERWWNHFEDRQVKVSDLLEEFRSDEALASLLPGKSDANDRTKLGYILRRKVETIHGGFRIVRVGIRNGACSYRLEQMAGRTSEDAGRTLEATPTSQEYGDAGSDKEESVGVVGVSRTFLSSLAHADARGRTCEGQLGNTPQVLPSGSKSYQSLDQSPTTDDSDDEVVL